MTIEELQKQITTLTGVKPASKSEEHLRARLRELQKHVSRPVSVTLAAAMAIDELAEEHDISISELVREAVAAWAKSKGHERQSRVIGEVLS